MDSSGDRDIREDILVPDEGDTESSSQGSNRESSFRFMVTIDATQFSQLTGAKGQIDDSVVEHLALILGPIIELGLMEQAQDNTAPQQVKIEKDMVDEKDSVHCPICLDSMTLSNHVMILPCSHCFHDDCIVPWLKEASACPCCRKRISPG